MIPLIIAGLFTVLPILPALFKIRDRWDFGSSFFAPASSSYTVSRSDLTYFYLDPGSLPAIDVAATNSKILPPLLFPVISGPHCTPDFDIAPQPVCFAIVDDPEFFSVSPYLEPDTFDFSWDLFEASTLIFAAGWIFLGVGVLYCLSITLPPYLMNSLEERAYLYFLAYHVHGADGLSAVLACESVDHFAAEAGFPTNNILGDNALVEDAALGQEHEKDQPLVDIGPMPAASSVTGLDACLAAQRTWEDSRSPSSSRLCLGSPRSSVLAASHTEQYTESSDNRGSSTASNSTTPCSPMEVSCDETSFTAPLGNENCKSCETANVTHSTPQDEQSSAAIVKLPSQPPVQSPSKQVQEHAPEQQEANATISRNAISVTSASISRSGAKRMTLQERSSNILATFAGRSLKSLYTASKQYQHAHPAPDSDVSDPDGERSPAKAIRLAVDAAPSRVRFLSGGTSLNRTTSAQAPYIKAQLQSAINFGTVARTLEQEEQEVARLEAQAYGNIPPLGFHPLTPSRDGVVQSSSSGISPASSVGNNQSSSQKYIPPGLRRERSQSESPQSPTLPTPTDIAVSTRPRIRSEGYFADSPASPQFADEVDSPLASRSSHKGKLGVLDVSAIPPYKRGLIWPHLPTEQPSTSPRSVRPHSVLRMRRSTPTLHPLREETAAELVRPSPSGARRALVGPVGGGEPFARMRERRQRQLSTAAGELSSSGVQTLPIAA